MATSKYLVLNSKLFPHRNIQIGLDFSWQEESQIDRRCHSSTLYVRSYRTADCGTDRYLVTAKARKRLSVRKEAAQEFDVKRFSLQNISDVEVRKQYRFEISNRFAGLRTYENDSKDMNKAWGNI